MITLKLDDRFLIAQLDASAKLQHIQNYNQ